MTAFQRWFPLGCAVGGILCMVIWLCLMGLDALEMPSEGKLAKFAGGVFQVDVSAKNPTVEPSIQRVPLIIGSVFFAGLVFVGLPLVDNRELVDAKTGAEPDDGESPSEGRKTSKGDE